MATGDSSWLPSFPPRTDSAATFSNDTGPVKIYRHANKVFNLVKVWPIGAMVYGSGGIGSASIETLSKDLRARLSDPHDGEYGLNPDTYTIEEVATKARKWFFEEHYSKTYPEPLPQFFMGYRVCGYSAGARLAEVWEFIIAGPICEPPVQLMDQSDFGIRWAGENEALDRLLMGASSRVKDVMKAHGSTDEQADEAYLEIIQAAGVQMVIPAMPIQDAIDLAQFGVETAAKFARFGLRPETIGGPIEIAAITTHEGFKWVSRKHYYSAELNRETDHV